MRKTLGKFGLDPKINWRGLEAGRLEALSDGVFALAIALLLFKTEVPDNFDDLYTYLIDFIPFSVSIVFILWIWYEHFIFFAFYGIADRITVVLNGLLIFLLLFYVYPLKFLITFNFKYFYLLWTTDSKTSYQYILETFGANDVNELMLIYGLGFTGIFAVLWLLHRHALKLKHLFELSAYEEVYAHILKESKVVLIFQGSLSSLLALIGIIGDYPMMGMFSGMSYALTGLWFFLANKFRWNAQQEAVKHL